MIKGLTRRLLTAIYRIQVSGFEYYRMAGERVLIVANHTSYLDPLLLWAFLPDDVTFAINTRIRDRWWIRPALRFARVFPLEPTQAMALKTLTQYLCQNRKAVIFPEGRITVTGALMKVYDGAGLIADKSGAMVLPVRIDGAQYTPFSRLRGIVRRRWFPRLALHFLPPRTLRPPAEVMGPDRRRYAGMLLADLMGEMLFATEKYRQTLFSALLDARQVHGGQHPIMEDVMRRPVSYNQLIAQALALGGRIAKWTQEGEAVGLLLPSMTGTVAVFLGLQVHGRIPAMLNYSAGTQSLLSACSTAGIRVVVTARRLVQMAKLKDALERLEAQVRIVYLEEVVRGIGAFEKVAAAIRAHTADGWHRRERENADSAAVILFTSGTEGSAKGVVLSHANLLANRAQLAARLDFNAQDILLNTLPLFHAFGLTGGTLLPLLSGIYTFLYISPLHYRVVPEIAYDLNATILFGTNTFLAAYGKSAHPFDFYSVRYVFAGAEKLQPDTRRAWMDKFGLRILEGYGTTETSPVLAANTSMFYREGTVGRFLPGIDWRLETVPGVTQGGKLHVRGPNVMLGYLRPEDPGCLQPVNSIYGQGWYDTGDVVTVDGDGFVRIQGRIKRFAKIGGELVSLTVVEDLAARAWPDVPSAALSVADPKTGEAIVLVTENPLPSSAALLEQARRDGISALCLPATVHTIEALPRLATGKVDYPALAAWLTRRREATEAAG